ncbi:MAG: tRNA pseudouridine(38-40) synthase TruA [Synergistes sp.]|nr:tRNA pseudouridine(38-40) synthase TruA [Synergistes sp.]
MNKYAAEISYDGGKFFGWQIQPGLPTVQESLEKTLSLIDGKKVKVSGAGRTDTGVHARAQVCSFEMQKEWQCRSLILAANANLPQGIRLMRAVRVPERFHARFSAVEREYRYFIWNSSTIYPHIEGKVCWIKPKNINWKLAADAASELIGTHDFRNFCHYEGYENTTIRTITKIKLINRMPLIILQLRGDGFLHNMVRIILGNIEKAGKKEISPHEILRLLNTEKSSRSDGGRTYPACGLYLWKIFYKENIWHNAESI